MYEFRITIEAIDHEDIIAPVELLLDVDEDGDVMYGGLGDVESSITETVAEIVEASNDFKPLAEWKEGRTPGTRWEVRGDKNSLEQAYILACIGTGFGPALKLIGLKNGNRWSDEEDVLETYVRPWENEG
jgi:hypothetical protein